MLAVGHSKGETLLPLPPLELPSADRASKDKERVHVLETAVVTWTKQIKNVLKLDPDSGVCACRCLSSTSWRGDGVPVV